MTYNVTFSKQFNAAGEGVDYPTDSLIVSRDVDLNPLFIEMRLPVPTQATHETGALLHVRLWLRSPVACRYAHLCGLHGLRR